MYGYILFIEEAWDVYVSTSVHLKNKLYVITHNRYK